MKVEYFKEYSNCLNREMEFKIYGHTGIPLLVFPAQDGRFYDFENFGMVSVIADKIEAGSIQVFCLDSIDGECWSDEGGNGPHRTYMMEQRYYYVMNELIPRIFDINGTGQKYILQDVQWERLMQLILCLGDLIYFKDAFV